MERRAWFCVWVLAMGCGTDPAASTDASRLIPDSGPPISMCLAQPEPSDYEGRCRCDSDCPMGANCAREMDMGFPGGACFGTCDEDSDCGSRGICRAGTMFGRCVTTCASSSDCEAGRYCFSGRCMALCQADAECESGHCDRNTGRCVAEGFEPTGARSSAPCLRDEDCRSSFCLEQFCATPCAFSANGCPDDEICVRDVGGTAIDLGICWPRCTTPADCPDPAASCVSTTDLASIDQEPAVLDPAVQVCL